MANPNRPRGFTPIKMLSGAPWAGNVRSVGVTAGTDIFLGDLLTLVGNLAVPTSSGNTTIVGVAVGFGKRDPTTGKFGGAYNPDVLTTLFYDDAANVAADWRVFYTPVEDMIFEAQTDAALNALPGTLLDVVPTAGSRVTGRSLQEIGTSSNGDLIVVENPDYSDNDTTLANARHWVTVPKAKTINK